MPERAPGKFTAPYAHNDDNPLFRLVSNSRSGMLGHSRPWPRAPISSAGLRVLSRDRLRAWLQLAVDALAALCLVLWAYENIATAWSAAQ